MVILSGHMRRAEAVHKDLQPKLHGWFATPWNIRMGRAPCRGMPRQGAAVDSTAKRNGSSKPDFDVPAKLRQEGLDGRSVSEALTRGEVDGHGDLLDVGFADLVEIGASGQPSSDAAVALRGR